MSPYIVIGPLSDSDHNDLLEQAQQLMEVPENFRCPISFTIMKDPVFKGGKTYERDAILKWMAQSGNKDPITKKVFPDDVVEPNFDKRSEIQEFMPTQIKKILLLLPKLM